MLTINDLKNILPQAYPFLMIDRVEEYTPEQSLIAIKNITANEWFFQNDENFLNVTHHFPETLRIYPISKILQCCNLEKWGIIHCCSKPKKILDIANLMKRGIEAAAQAALVLFT